MHLGQTRPQRRRAARAAAAAELDFDLTADLEALPVHPTVVERELGHADHVDVHINCPEKYNHVTKALEEKEALNKNTAQLQFEVLEKQKKWISDTEADKLLNSGY